MSQSALFKTNRFLPLFITQFLGAFNDNFLKNAMVILITFKGSTVFGLPPSEQVVLAGGVFILPFFLFSATSGQLADRYEKTSIIRFVKLSEIAIMLLASVGFLLHHYEFLVLVLFLMGVHSTVFGPVKYSILPQLLDESEIVGGTAIIEAGTFIAILLGTIVGGMTIAIDPNGPMIASIGLTSAAVLGYIACLFIPRTKIGSPSLEVQWSGIKPTINILKTVYRSRSLFYAVSAISWFWFYGAAFLSLFPIYAKDILHADQGVVTLFLAMFSIGIAFGSMLCESMSRKRLEVGLVPFGSLGMSCFAIILYFIGTPNFVFEDAMNAKTVSDFLSNSDGLLILGILFMMSVFCGFFIVPLYTLMQIRSKPEERSQVVAANNIMNACYMVGASIALLLFIKAGLRPTDMFFVLGMMNLVVATYIYLYMPEFLLRFYAWIITRIMYRFKVTGHEHIPVEGPGVVVCNHVTFVDWLVIAAGVKRPLRFVMDHSFYKGFILRTLFNQAKVIPIAPAKEDPALLERAFERIAEELEKGNLICIFPEGKITKDGKMNIFKPGIEKIIGRTPVPVIPMGLCNLWGSFFSRERGQAIKKVPKRFWSPIELRIEPAIAPENATAESLQIEVQKIIDQYEQEP